jgi:hypothetical protein
LRHAEPPPPPGGTPPAESKIVSDDGTVTTGTAEEIGAEIGRNIARRDAEPPVEYHEIGGRRFMYRRSLDARRTPTPPPVAPAPVAQVAPIARPRERRDSTRRSSSSSSSSSSSDPDPPAPARPAPSSRIADRHADVASGWARRRHADLDRQLDDAVAADHRDRGPTRGQLTLPGLEGRRF